MSSPMSSPMYVAEPEVAYSKRAPLVVDSSVLAAWVFGEPRAAEAQARVQGHALFAPNLLIYEMANIGMNKIRSRQLDAPAAVKVLGHFHRFDVSYRQIEGAAMLTLAAKLKLTAYDAAYICLAESLGAPLVTFDEALAKAALAHFSKAAL